MPKRKTLKQQLAKKKIIKKASLDRLLTFDSYLHQLILELLLFGIELWNNPMYEQDLRKQDFSERPPIDQDTIKYVSRVLRVVYLKQEIKISEEQKHGKKTS